MNRKAFKIANVLRQLGKDEAVLVNLREVSVFRNPWSPKEAKIVLSYNGFNLSRRFPDHLLEVSDLCANHVAADLLKEFFVCYYDEKLKNYLAKS